VLQALEILGRERRSDARLARQHPRKLEEARERLGRILFHAYATPGPQGAHLERAGRPPQGPGPFLTTSESRTPMESVLQARTLGAGADSFGVRTLTRKESRPPRHLRRCADRFRRYRPDPRRLTSSSPGSPKQCSTPVLFFGKYASKSAGVKSVLPVP